MSKLDAAGDNTTYDEPRGDHIRVDSGVKEDWEVTSYYDPLVAKLAVWGSDRPEAIARIKKALEDYTIGGLTTNLQMHREVLDDEVFRQATYHTSWLETR